MVHSGDVATEMSMLVPHTAPEQHATRVQHSLAVPRHKTKQPIRRVAANCFMNLSYISISEPQIPWQGGRFSVRNLQALCCARGRSSHRRICGASAEQKTEGIHLETVVLGDFKSNSERAVLARRAKLCHCVCVCEALFIGSFVT